MITEYGYKQQGEALPFISVGQRPTLECIQFNKAVSLASMKVAQVFRPVLTILKTQVRRPVLPCSMPGDSRLTALGVFLPSRRALPYAIELRPFRAEQLRNGRMLALHSGFSNTVIQKMESRNHHKRGETEKPDE